MWIEGPPNLVRIDPQYLPDAPDSWTEPLEFNASGSAQTTEEIAQYLINDYDADITQK